LSPAQFWTRFWQMPGFERPQSVRGDTKRIDGIQVNCVRARIPADLSWELPSGEIIVRAPTKSAPSVIDTPKVADGEPILITVSDKDFTDEQWSF